MRFKYSLFNGSGRPPRIGSDVGRKQQHYLQMSHPEWGGQPLPSNNCKMHQTILANVLTYQ